MKRACQRGGLGASMTSEVVSKSQGPLEVQTTENGGRELRGRAVWWITGEGSGGGELCGG